MSLSPRRRGLRRRAAAARGRLSPYDFADRVDVHARSAGELIGVEVSGEAITCRWQQPMLMSF